MFEKTKGLIFGGLLVLATYAILLIFTPEEEQVDKPSKKSKKSVKK